MSMVKNFVEELRWRGMIHELMPGTEEMLSRGVTSGYVGIDPTADSLHIGHLVSVMMLKHFQRAGHRPIAVLGGATGMIGDPSMKSAERNLLDQETLKHNQECIGRQLAKFIDFESDAPNAAKLCNNYSWMKDYSFIDFARDIGKHITVNYMMAKDSVKKRLADDTRSGLSFTEFSYQLLQGYDFLHLYREEGVRIQMGGSDQWGNITTGTELIRRIEQGEAYALTCPLITKADGGKFGKTESGNIWLDRRYTSPYRFYQFWINVNDTDAAKYIKIFTVLDQEEIAALEQEQAANPHERPLQKRLAREVTVMVHSEQDYEMAVKASEILFGRATKSTLQEIDEETFLSVFDGVPRAEVQRELLAEGVGILDLLVEHTGFFGSKGELRKLIKSNGISLNKERVESDDCIISTDSLISDRYLIVQRGRKNYYLIQIT